MCHTLCKQHRDKLTIKNLFFACMIFGLVFYILAMIISNGKTLVYSLFFNPDDVFMDFFHSAFDSLKPYEETKQIYPPFIRLIFALIGSMMTPFAADAFAARTTVVGAMLFTIFLIMTATMIYWCVNKNYHDKGKELLILLLLLSMPLLWCIERGNIIIIAALLLMPFVMWYDSDTKWKRYVAYLCLAISVNIKLYPIVFSLLIIKNKKFKEFIVFIAVCAIVFFGSLLILNDSFTAFIKNLFSTSEWGLTEGVGITNVVSSILSIVGAQDFTKSISYVIMVIVIIIATVCILVDKNMKKWKQAMLLSLILCTCGTFNGFYCLTYVFIPLVLFLDSNPNPNVNNGIYLIMFILMTIPMIGILDQSGQFVALSCKINGFVPTIAIIYLLIEECHQLLKTRHQYYQTGVKA